MSLVFRAKSNVLWGHFQCAVQQLQRAAQKMITARCDVSQHVETQSAVQSAVAKSQSTQWYAVRHSTTALLSLKNYIIVYVYVYACTYRGSNRDVHKVLCAPPMVSA